ncbi:hypothetical protein D1AOALGA4SA_4469 [Olavius algarvensis Delta 1 endosymbiont]|nr:hypothetical protein D1AOALGA4SA_4469 [Olavius algarvensis Delta 1 endosymbiont]
MDSEDRRQILEVGSRNAEVGKHRAWCRGQSFDRGLRISDCGLKDRGRGAESREKEKELFVIRYWLLYGIG